MHKIHNTLAIVLDSLPYSEGSSTVILYTEELGLVYARAQSAREEKSKMRFALQPLSFLEVSLVHGRRAGWRVTGVLFEESFVSKEIEVQEMFARILKLFRRVVNGESVDGELFEFLVTTFSNIEKYNKEELECVELLAVARMLAILGYIPRDVLKIPLLMDFEYDDEKIKLIFSKKKKLVEIINEAIIDSQL